MGAACAAGIGVEAAWPRIADGADGLEPLTSFDSGLKQPPLCAPCPPELHRRLGERAPNRTAALALLATREAVGPFRETLFSLRLGLVVATTVAGMARSEQLFRRLLVDDSALTHASGILNHHEPTNVTFELSRKYHARTAMTVSTACSTGLHAVGMGCRLIESGRCDACLAVGTDALSLLTIRGFGSLVLVAPEGCRPFDKSRAGISLGEGAGALLLASEDTCRRLHAVPRAAVSGWGASSDCHHMTAPHPEGRGAASAMRGALTEAGLEPADIDAIIAHGTGTPDNDLAEVRALREVFGTLPPFCSMKRTLGHTLGASGTLEAVFAATMLEQGYVPRSGGFEQPDEAIGAAPSAGEARPLRHVVKNAFGFGGNNASIVLSRAES